MYDAADNVCAADYDGRRSKCGWAYGRGGAKWQRWWRRWTAGMVAYRRVLAEIEHHYDGRWCGETWGMRRLDDPEVRQHLFVVKLGGKGQFGEQWARRQSYDWNTSGKADAPWVEANGNGPSFRILTVGKWRKRKPSRRCCRDHFSSYADRERRRHYVDQYYRWSQRRLRDAGAEGRRII